MSEHVTVSQLSRATQITQEWLKDLAERSPFETEEEAYSHLRAVLHALRDRLTVEEAAHLGSQLPMMVRGFYFEGWRPALAPNDFTTEEAFFERVKTSLGGAAPTDGPTVPEASRAVLALLAERIDAGELDHVRSQLPRPIDALFPGGVAA